jgi:hypothetical protein
VTEAVEPGMIDVRIHLQEFENPPERKEPPVSEISAVEYENLGGVIVLEKELELSVVAASRQV